LSTRSFNQILTKIRLPAEREKSHTKIARRPWLKVDGSPFFIIGMQVGERDNVPDRYLRDLAAHGINTLFYWAVRDSSGRYDLVRINHFLTQAGNNGFKVVLGLPLMGAKMPEWRRTISAYLKLIDSLKDNKAIIAWEPVDEPGADTWRDAELIEIYGLVKRKDPHRPVLVNWGDGAVPVAVGAEPCGTFKSSDFYSIDCYPFAGETRSMNGCADISVRALETSRIFGKVPHSWLQLYGGMDAWREPTGDELNYMAYLNLLYGGMFSYWNTKSNSAATWQRLGEINHQAQILADRLFLNPQAREIRMPTFQGNLAWSAWRVGREIYLITLHNSAAAETLDIDLSGVIGSRAMSGQSLFEDRTVAVRNNHIREIFSPYQSKVYVVVASN
jgi:hypothetical protein